MRIVPIDLVSEDTNHSVYSIVEGDPLSAAVSFHATTRHRPRRLERPSRGDSSMRADAEAFHVTSELTAFENGEPVFSRAWEHRFPRDHV